MEVEDLKHEIAGLKRELAEKNAAIESLVVKLRAYESKDSIQVSDGVNLPSLPQNQDLTNNDIAKFSRQLILPELRVKSQKILKGSSVLIVGCGGLGCPTAVYLACAGLGRLGLVDYDTVEVSNLHRQILHRQSRLGELKCVSVAKSLAELNPDVEYVPIHSALDSANALEIVKQYDVVLDCSDNVATRYLLNDACVLSGVPLVSGSALRWEGQLTVYNYKGGPTYRCLYPSPPPPDAVTNCSDGGVLGPVPGVIGVLQAMECIKVLTGVGSTLSGRLLLYDGLESRFRVVKLRGRTREADEVKELIDYVQFCGSGATDKDEGIDILEAGHRISVRELDSLKEEHILVDVRPDVEYEMGSLPNTTNIPLPQFQAPELLDKHFSELKQDVILICRRGNDSQRACLALSQYVKQKELKVSVRDVTGGLQAWARHIDSSFPIY